MGTRADFWIGVGDAATWLGSVAWDGYPDGMFSQAPNPIDRTLIDLDTIHNEDEWRRAVEKFITEREDGTTPKMGWPWPWNDSRTTDYAYTFTDGKVMGSCFGHAFFDPANARPYLDEDASPQRRYFPDMSKVKRVTMGKRSGMMVIGAEGIIEED